MIPVQPVRTDWMLVLVMAGICAGVVALLIVLAAAVVTFFINYPLALIPVGICALIGAWAGLLSRPIS